MDPRLDEPLAPISLDALAKSNLMVIVLDLNFATLGQPDSAKLPTLLSHTLDFLVSYLL